MTEEELKQKEDALTAMEAEIQKKCEKIDKREEEMEKKVKKAEQLVGLSEGTDVFLKLSGLINEMYTLWVAKKGTPDGILESAQKIIEARRDLEAPTP